VGEIKLLVVDSNPAVLDGLCSVIETQPDMEITGVARSVLEATAKAEKLHPNVILMDANMPQVGGIEATRWIKTNIPGINILVLTIHPIYMGESFAAGADGYLLKDCRRADLLETIRNIMAERIVKC